MRRSGGGPGHGAGAVAAVLRLRGDPGPDVGELPRTSAPSWAWTCSAMAATNSRGKSGFTAGSSKSSITTSPRSSGEGSSTTPMTNRASERGLADASEPPDRHRAARRREVPRPEVREHVLAPDEVVGRHGPGVGEEHPPLQVVREHRRWWHPGRDPAPPARHHGERGGVLVVEVDDVGPAPAPRRERSSACWTGVSGTASTMAADERKPVAVRGEDGGPDRVAEGPHGGAVRYRYLLAVLLEEVEDLEVVRLRGKAEQSSWSERHDDGGAHRNRRRVSVTAAVVIRDPASRRCVHVRGRPARRWTAGRPGRTPPGPEPRCR